MTNFYKYTAIFLAVLFLVASMVLYFTYNESRRLSAENSRLTKNVNALNAAVKVFKTKSGKSAAKTEAVTYTKAELKKYHPEITQAISDAGIRPQDVQSVAQVAFTAKVDTVVPTQKTDTSVCFNYTDKNFTVVGCYYPGNNTANIAAGYTDSLKIIPTRVPYRFWFIRWGCKAVELNVISGNKATIFNYAKYIELKP